jgi:ABC-type multidrug transport system fused ATPase/permease subunit
MSSFVDLAAALRVLHADIDRTVAWRLGATALLVVVGGLLAGLAPLALKGMIDAAGQPTPHGQTSPGTTLVFAAAYLLALCSGRLLTELRPSLIATAEQRLYARLRRRFFAHLLHLPLAFHRDRQSGALAQGLQQAILGYQIIVFNLVNSVVPVLVEIVTVTLVLFSLGEPALMTTFAATALAYLAVLRSRGAQIKSSARGVSEASTDANGMLIDGLLNVETIKCFGAEGTARLRFDRATSLLEQRWSTFQRERLRVGLTVAAVFALSMTALLAVAVHAVLRGTLSVGGFVLANAYMLQVARPLEMLGTAARDLSQAVEFIRPVIDVLREVGEAPDDCERLPGACVTNDIGAETASDAPTVDRRGALSLSLRDVCFAYAGGNPVLNGLSLDIAAGSRVAIVGASGSGKSSLIRLLLRLEEPQAGSITLGGLAIDTLSAREVRKRIAVVPQDTMLFNETVAFNIGIGKANAARWEIERAARVARMHAFICSLPAGYETVVGERGLKLSGGERQRIAIARAVLKDPEIYVLDEATSMLDSATETQILRNLREISAGVTTVTIAHRLSTIRDAGEIVVLRGGVVAEHGDHASLLASGREYAALWREQLGAHS